MKRRQSTKIRTGIVSKLYRRKTHCGAIDFVRCADAPRPPTNGCSAACRSLMWSSGTVATVDSCTSLPRTVGTSRRSSCRSPGVAPSGRRSPGRRRDCQFADTPLSIPIETPTYRERGVQQNNSLADGQGRRVAERREISFRTACLLELVGVLSAADVALVHPAFPRFGAAFHHRVLARRRRWRGPRGRWSGWDGRRDDAARSAEGGGCGVARAAVSPEARPLLVPAQQHDRCWRGVRVRARRRQDHRLLPGRLQAAAAAEPIRLRWSSKCTAAALTEPPSSPAGSGADHSTCAGAPGSAPPPHAVATSSPGPFGVEEKPRQEEESLIRKAPVLISSSSTHVGGPSETTPIDQNSHRYRFKTL